MSRSKVFSRNFLSYSTRSCSALLCSAPPEVPANYVSIYGSDIKDAKRANFAGMLGAMDQVRTLSQTHQLSVHMDLTLTGVMQYLQCLNGPGQGVGNLTAALITRGMMQNIIIVFTAE